MRSGLQHWDFVARSLAKRHAPSKNVVDISQRVIRLFDKHRYSGDVSG